MFYQGTRNERDEDFFRSPRVSPPRQSHQTARTLLQHAIARQGLPRSTAMVGWLHRGVAFLGPFGPAAPSFPSSNRAHHSLRARALVPHVRPDYPTRLENDAARKQSNDPPMRCALPTWCSADANGANVIWRSQRSHVRGWYITVLARLPRSRPEREPCPRTAAPPPCRDCRSRPD